MGAKQFNNAAALDLKHWDHKSYMPYTTDLFTKITLSFFIKKQKSSRHHDLFSDSNVGRFLIRPKDFQQIAEIFLEEKP